MLGLDHYAPFLLSAFGITVVVLIGYMLYLRSRMRGLQRRAAAIATSEQQAYSGRNVTAAAPRATTAQAASSANGPSSA